MGVTLNSLPQRGFVLSLRCEHRFQTLSETEGKPPPSRKFPEGLLKTFRFTGWRPYLPAPDFPAPDYPVPYFPAPYFPALYLPVPYLRVSYFRAPYFRAGRPPGPYARATRGSPARSGPAPGRGTGGPATPCPWWPSRRTRPAGPAAGWTARGRGRGRPGTRTRPAGRGSDRR